MTNRYCQAVGGVVCRKVGTARLCCEPAMIGDHRGKCGGSTLCWSDVYLAATCHMQHRSRKVPCYRKQPHVLKCLKE